VVDKPVLIKPEDIDELPLQIMALPWISRSGLMTHLSIQRGDLSQIYEEIEVRLTELVGKWFEQIDPQLPLVLTAHASVQGATYGAERTVMLGTDLVLPGSLVRDPRLDYVALGHIHKPQNLNENAHPPVIYPGSIERVDWGEAQDDKFFVIAHVERGKTEVEWRQLENIRPFIDRSLRLETKEDIQAQLLGVLPKPEEMQGAIVRLTIEYPRDWEALIDDVALRDYAEGAFEFHLVKQPQIEARVRIPDDQSVGSLSPLELLDLYWRASHTEDDELDALNRLASEVIEDVHRESGSQGE
jgi:exonuclease SbcD